MLHYAQIENGKITTVIVANAECRFHFGTGILAQ